MVRLSAANGCIQTVVAGAKAPLFLEDLAEEVEAIGEGLRGGVCGVVGLAVAREGGVGWRADYPSEGAIDFQQGEWRMSLYAVLQANGLLGIGVPEEAESIFDEIAETLLNETILRVGGRPYRLVEIEFYANGSTHPDPFAHCDEMQLRTAHWYFHRTGEEYRGGSFKGLDITFAPEGYYGGILIRTIEGWVPEGQEEVFVSGPSLSVDHILAGCGAGSVVELVEKMGDRSVVREDADRLLWLEHDPSISKREVVKTPRFGLFLKRGDGKNTPAESLPSRYVMREYRYISDARRVKKGRHFTSLSLALQGADLETIHQRVGTPRKSITSYIEAFEAGKQKSLRSFFFKDVSTTEQCELYGACAAAGYTRYGKA